MPEGAGARCNGSRTLQEHAQGLRTPTSLRANLIALQFVRHGRVSCATPYMYHAHEPGGVIDGKEDAIDMRPPPVAQYPHGLIRIDALRRDRTALRVLIEGKNRALQTVEPIGALLSGVANRAILPAKTVLVFITRPMPLPCATTLISVTSMPSTR